MYPKCLEEYLSHNRCSRNPGWMSAEWKEYTSKGGISNTLELDIHLYLYPRWRVRPNMHRGSKEEQASMLRVFLTALILSPLRSTFLCTFHTLTQTLSESPHFSTFCFIPIVDLRFPQPLSLLPYLPEVQALLPTVWLQCPGTACATWFCLDTGSSAWHQPPWVPCMAQDALLGKLGLYEEVTLWSVSSFTVLNNIRTHLNQ